MWKYVNSFSGRVSIQEMEGLNNSKYLLAVEGQISMFYIT